MGAWLQEWRDAWTAFEEQAQQDASIPRSIRFRRYLQERRARDYAPRTGSWIAQTRIEAAALAGVELLLLVTILPQQRIAPGTEVALVLLAIALPIHVLTIIAADPSYENMGDTATGILVFTLTGPSFLVLIGLGILLFQASIWVGLFFTLSVLCCIILGGVVAILARYAKENASKAPTPPAQP